MKEDFLHYLWQFQVFNKKRLLSTDGELLDIRKTGLHNTNSGPDFTEAQVYINQQHWVGNIEIHLQSSDWYVHAHEQDKAFDNVILHVVWEEDVPVFRSNNTPICTLELKGLVPKHILDTYATLFHKKRSWIACENTKHQVDSFTWNNWLERLYIERLEEKSILISRVLKATKNNWEAVLFKLLAKSFGLKVNSDSFEALSDSIPFSVIRKERESVTNLEALLLGQAGLLTSNEGDSYYTAQQETYRYLKQKYQLEPASISVQFFRLRPPNFPTIRLSQLAHLYAGQYHLFQKLMTEETLDSLYTLLQTQASLYWDTHYSYGKETKKRIKKTSKSFIDLLLINSIIPLQFAYQQSRGTLKEEKLFQLIRAIKPEQNNVIKKFSSLDFQVKTAMDTQALLQLKKKYCEPQRCLSCQIGVSLFRNPI